MDEQTKQLLIERIGEVPVDVREVILSDMLTEDIQSISTEHGLTDEQRDALQSEIRLVLLGVTELEHFTENIRVELSLENKAASDIVLSVDTRIFSPVRKALNVVHGYASAKEAVGATKKIDTDTLVPKKATSDPVASSILGDNRRPGAQSDPYREPIDEE